ncbi:hypothetical protein V4V56_003871 [Vibrio mimicus]|uniref:hypothetical protein n=1 Tax=Vibrio mimicus TaxID=674 RepID=UPI0012AD1B1A|nr:hypothetical protein [Vibrio mimicus]EKZ9180877.1 hypothetical protein [Vibrio vulnificus]
MKEKFIGVDILIDEYMKNSRLINQSNGALLGCSKGFLGRNLKAKLIIAREEHKNYCMTLEELDAGFVGDLEPYSHGDLAHLGVKDANYKVVSRARTVCLDSLERFEKTLVGIEDSLNFNLSMKLAWLSIGIAIVSIFTNFIGN